MIFTALWGWGFRLLQTTAICSSLQLAICLPLSQTQTGIVDKQIQLSAVFTVAYWIGAQSL